MLRCSLRSSKSIWPEMYSWVSFSILGVITKPSDLNSAFTSKIRRRRSDRSFVVISGVVILIPRTNHVVLIVIRLNHNRSTREAEVVFDSRSESLGKAIQGSIDGLSTKSTGTKKRATLGRPRNDNLNLIVIKWVRVSSPH